MLCTSASKAVCTDAPFHQNSSHSELGSTLLDRLCRPLLPGDPDFRSLNDNTKQSLSYLREKLEEIERHNLEMGSLLPQQEAILREFLLYCEFEHRIERVLLWMQEQGLTKIQGFSHIGENGEAVKTQVTEFKAFTEKCQVSEGVCVCALSSSYSWYCSY